LRTGDWLLATGNWQLAIGKKLKLKKLKVENWINGGNNYF